MASSLVIRKTPLRNMVMWYDDVISPPSQFRNDDGWWRNYFVDYTDGRNGTDGAYVGVHAAALNGTCHWEVFSGTGHRCCFKTVSFYKYPRHSGDVITLITSRYASLKREPPAVMDPKAYLLRIADESGKADEDYPGKKKSQFLFYLFLWWKTVQRMLELT